MEFDARYTSALINDRSIQQEAKRRVTQLHKSVRRRVIYTHISA